ncbi:MAG: C4-type zinc ribbon domain-containing protein [Smithellaceae bacterium]|nr:C4-type zinc ribbon domain-containing protein [Smithellaceae bacterium]
MREELKLLIELQRTELALRGIDLKRKALPERLVNLARDFDLGEAEVNGYRQKLDEANKRRQEKEEKLKKEGEALKRTRGRLYEVKTNKEYNAILKEIETAEEVISRFESDIINLLEEQDALKKALKPKEEELAIKAGQYEQEKRTIEEELAGLDGRREENQQESDGLREKIPPALLKKFDAIKGANAGVALSSVWKAVCGGCHMNIPAQLYIDLQKTSDLAFCPNCQRIIYWYDQNAACE